MAAAFTAGLLLIIVSELGDKTFFITAILSMRHARRWVFVGSVLALATMTVLAVLTGQMAALLPQNLIHFAEVALFLGFGGKLIYDASRMSGRETLDDEVQAATATVGGPENGTVAMTLPWAILSKAFALTFIAEWGDRTQFATITLAAGQNPYGVTAGATLGHAICALIAVCCGRLVAGHLSEKTLTLMGGGLFLLFGLIAMVKAA
ncbi:hypothetical protein C7271_06110 [filamentous cyanobacterium CCP5]|nr:hypothetical protein C7271_06110 [filamentous cyanobacterium CCP5]